jgi:hypothetical protein
MTNIEYAFILRDHPEVSLSQITNRVVAEKINMVTIPQFYLWMNPVLMEGDVIDYIAVTYGYSVEKVQIHHTCHHYIPECVQNNSYFNPIDYPDVEFTYGQLILFGKMPEGESWETSGIFRICGGHNWSITRANPLLSGTSIVAGAVLNIQIIHGDYEGEIIQITNQGDETIRIGYKTPHLEITPIT